MNIAIIGPAHPLRGGLATFDERLAEEIQNHGHEVVIYSFSLQYPSFLFPGTTQYTTDPAPAQLRIETRINSVNPLNWWRTGNYIRRRKHDLVIVRYWLPFMGPALGTILRRVKKNGHTRILCIADNVLPHEKRPGDLPFTRYFLKAPDAFITMSRKVLEDLKDFSSKPAVFSPHPLYDNFGAPLGKEEACRRLGLDPNERYLLFFGFIRRYKGLDLMFEVMNDPRIREAGIRLIVAGEYYDDRSLYEELYNRYNLQDRVHLFTDFIPNSEVALYFSAADLVVQPYRNATQSGITQVAYHFEKPMVVTNVGGLAEGVPDGKVGYVTPVDKDAIATAILRFFNTADKEAMHAAIREEKKKYAWSTFFRNLMQAAGFNY